MNLLQWEDQMDVWSRTAQSSGTLSCHWYLSKQVRIIDFFLVGSWLDCCLELFHDYVEIDLVILNTKDSCDGSGLNTSESSKGSHP